MPFPTARKGLLAAGVVASFTLLTACGATETVPGTEPGAPITSTTRIASAGVLGNHRRPDESCAPEPAPAQSPDAPRQVRNATGPGVAPDTEVRGDPQRIVALSASALDALCALGLQGRVVGTAVPQPSYLGTVLHDAPGVGPRDTPDLDAVRAAAPDLILGSVAQTPGSFTALSEIAPTVFTGGPTDWQDTLRAVAAATARPGAADAALDGFERDAREAGARADATHFQASVLQFTETTIRVFGAANFPATVLRAVGVDRPAAQRFTDTPYIELSTADLSGDTDLSAADGDIIYLSFETAAAKERATTVLNSQAWRALSANRDDRVFAVNNEVWQSGQGVIAARGIVEDLRWLNAPIN
ncbi:Fe3+-citrate ABC transporter substrate-binding protein [Mycobacterium adipatum]|uniref:Fe3+-citrate ABC transporter substrate-binding protein n=1 Tax=Mycobacterium adipatum TaxID=1682113 RepID=A0A172UQ67_9MYCO|nr:Fe3+-citrate ABC transporter substrate-binding protein [Mycobacterium adipatum]MBI5735510.1 ABC transporter substrate-binding protein [Mycolicibacterium neoaurum]